jgi:hypothetical protein
MDEIVGCFSSNINDSQALSDNSAPKAQIAHSQIEFDQEEFEDIQVFQRIKRISDFDIIDNVESAKNPDGSCL